MSDVLETRRLILRPLRLEDAARTQKIFPHWEIVKYLNAIVPWPFPEDGVLNHYRDVVLPASDTFESRGEQQSRFLDGSRVAGARIDDGGGCCGERLLVPRAGHERAARAEGRGECCVAADFREDGHADGCDNGEQLCLRATTDGDLGDYRRGMAREEGAITLASPQTRQIAEILCA
jgi:hypothetical protein